MARHFEFCLAAKIEKKVSRFFYKILFQWIGGDDYYHGFTKNVLTRYTKVVETIKNLNIDARQAQTLIISQQFSGFHAFETNRYLDEVIADAQF